ncbi:unnamed protein product [Phyllotreta striolata]|uniref:Vitellogenin n=1 Tax=Phyllotreta striolata TaxID=444603 RepID=A0A9N9XK76_PHYSR|nr:unnamed protein product [Phyllotreta striolata]
MWSPLFILVLAGFALGSNRPAWRDNQEYIYSVQGRALAGLEIANEFSGILLKAKLKLQTRPDGKLQGIIMNPQYAQIHSELSDGWMTYIPDHHVSWKPLEMVRKPFQIEMKRGIITNVIVNKGVSNWEANIIKGILSQFQMSLSVADEQDNSQNSAYFKTFEETVTGNTETLYEVSPFPQYALNSLNYEIPRLQKMNDNYLEVTKHKNFTNDIELPSYFYGLGNIVNKGAVVGRFFLRNTVTRAILSGNMKQYTIEHSLTMNDIVVHPTLRDQQTGAVHSLWNTTLQEVKAQSEILEDISSPVSLGSLVYAYNKPFAKLNKVEERSSQKYEFLNDRPALQRLNPQLFSSYLSSELRQNTPRLNQAAENPLFPLFIGNKGHSIKSEINVVETCINLCREMGEDIQDPRKTLHNNIYGKFSSLISLLRLMDESELRQISKALYRSEDNAEGAPWTIFVDAVAETGQGPALTMIETLIESKQIQNQQAAHIFSTMAKATQHPTTQYMKTLFNLVKKPVVANYWPLNETALLSYADLVRKVYFGRDYYDTHYPKHTFENLKDKEGLSFVRNTVIPYFSQRLDKAVTQADTRKIHAYIRALGQIGSPDILKTYEPYLEGDKRCSDFQRVLMVVAMDKIARNYPEIARPVLMKIYQNNAETSEVRVAAVFQIMFTYPDAETLQYMASYTKIDTDEQVNAAVKSSIQSASKRATEQFKTLRKAALTAEPLLTDKEYGLHQGGNYFRTYFIEQMEYHYKQSAQILSGDWGYVPNGIHYYSGSVNNALEWQHLNVEGWLTSVGQLVYAFDKQTTYYNEEKEMKERLGESKNHPWSSENIAKMLNMKSDMMDGFEGYLFTPMNVPYQMLSLDNTTFWRLPELVQKWERNLKNGEDIHYVKFLNNDHLALAMPNELGLPFTFTYNAPMFARINGNVRAAASPELFQKGKINIPNNLQVKVNVSITVGSKIMTKLAFNTPFDHQEYSSGIDKVWQAHVPIVGKIQFDSNKKELQLNVQPREMHQGAHLFHYSTWPYTSIKDVMNAKPEQEHHQIIKPHGLRRFDNVFGKKETGMAFKVEMERERNTLSMPDFRVFCEHGISNGLANIWNDDKLQYSMVNITYLPQESSTQEITMRMKYQKEYKTQGEQSNMNWQEVMQTDSPSTRQNRLLKSAASGINNVQTYAVEASIDFEGHDKTEHVVSGAYAWSNVDAKSRVYALYRHKKGNERVSQIKFEADNTVPNVNSLDLQDILSAQPRASSNVNVKFDNINGEGKIAAEIKLSRSEERKRYLSEQPFFHQCLRDERLGNKQSPACLNMTIEANLLDRVNVDLDVENVSPAVRSMVETVYSHLKYEYYPSLKFEGQSSNANNKINIRGQFDDDLKYLNVTVKNARETVTFRDIELNEYAKRILVVHPVFEASIRALSKPLEIDTFKSVCIVDQSQITTFSNNTYPGDLSKEWTVAAQFVPRMKHDATRQLQKQRENFAILVRQSKDHKQGKDIKIVVSFPETKYKVIDITMISKPQGPVRADVKVNEKSVQVSGVKAHDIEDGYIQIYSTPNGEIKTIVQGRIYVFYDGQRVKIGTINGFLRHGNRGICGQFNDQSNEDGLTSQNCYTRDPQKLIQSYEIQGSRGQQVRQELKSDPKQCVEKKVPILIDVIDGKHVDEWPNKYQEGSSCSRFQTKYVKKDNQLCFTVRPVLTCRSECHPQGFITKTLAAHCIDETNVAQLWASQVDKGASPDFSSKIANKNVQMEIPISCGI